MLRYMRLAAAVVVLVLTAMNGMVVGPTAEPVRAALAAVGVNDSLTMKHDRTAIVPPPGVLANDLNLIGGTTAILVSDVSHGTLFLSSDGGYTYSPAAAYVGTDQFSYKPSGLLSTAATVTITITNAAPVARPDAYSGAAGATMVVAAPGVLANDTDADGDALTTQLVGGISGSLDLQPNGGFTYTPGGGFSGTATFNYRVWDGVAWSSTTTVSLNIAAPSPTPSPTPTATPGPLPSVPLPSIPPPSIPPPSIPPPSIPLPTLLPTPSQPLPSIELFVSPTPAPSGTSGSPTSSQAPPGAPSAGGAASSSDPTANVVPGSAASPRPDLSLSLPPVDLGAGTIGVIGGFEIWAVPAAVIGGPGLLFLLFIALQAAGAITWIPAARRLRDDDRTKTDRGAAA